MRNKGETLAEILRDYKDCFFFLHNTKELTVAEKIMEEGFVFETQLSRSTDRVNPNEPVEVSYFLLQRKDYGAYTVVLAIPKATYEIYASISNQINVGIEEVMTISEPYYGDNDELIYTLSNKNLLGFYDIKNSEFFRNINWDPRFNNCEVAHSKKTPSRPHKR